MVGKGPAKKLANRLRRENRHGRSYRRIAREDYPARKPDGTPVVKQGTLNRIATTKGEWMPVRDDILIALGLKKARPPRIPPAPLEPWQIKIRKLISKMRADTKKAMER